MSHWVSCNRCEMRRPSADNVGWASVYVYAPRVGPGRKGEPTQLDLCAACVVELGLDKL